MSLPMLNGFWGFLLDMTSIVGGISLLRVISKATDDLRLQLASSSSDSAKSTPKGRLGFELSVAAVACLPLILFLLDAGQKLPSWSISFFQSTIHVFVVLAVLASLIQVSRLVIWWIDRSRRKKEHRHRLDQRIADINAIHEESDLEKRQVLTAALMQRQREQRNSSEATRTKGTTKS